MIKLIDMDFHQDVGSVQLMLRFTDDELSQGEVLMPRELAIDVIKTLAASLSLNVLIEGE